MKIDAEAAVPTEYGEPLPTLEDLPAVLDHLPAMIAYWDRSVRNVFANAAFVEWYETPAEELRGRHLQRLFAPEVYLLVLPQVTQALAGRRGEYVMSAIDRNGLIRHVNVVFVPNTHDGVTHGFYTMGIDITDRVRAQEAERVSTGQIAAYLERERISEHLHAEALQHLFAAMLTLGLYDPNDPKIAQVMTGLTSAIKDLREVGLTRSVIESPARGTSADGAAAPWTAGELVDILDHLPAAVAFWDNNLRVRFVNRTAAAWFGRNRPDAVGRPGRELIGDALIAEHLAFMQAAIAGAEQRFVRELSTPDGRQRTVQTAYVPNWSGGRVDGFFILSTDLTELVKARATVRQAEAAADLYNRAYMTLAQANEAILRAPDEATLYRETCRIAVEWGGYIGAWVGVPGTDGMIEVRSSAGAMDDYIRDLRISTDADSQFGRGPTGTAVRENRSVFCSHFGSDPSTQPWQEQASPYGIQSSATIPLRCADEPVAALSLYAAEPNAFDPHMRALMETLAANMSFALAALSDRRELRRLAGRS